MSREFEIDLSEEAELRDAFDAAGLPMHVVWGNIAAYGGKSLYEQGIAYRLEIDGVEAGDHGVGRIEVRADGAFHLRSSEWDYLGDFEALQAALCAADEHLAPRYLDVSPGR